MTPALLFALLATTQPAPAVCVPQVPRLPLRADSTGLQAYAGIYTFPEGTPISQFVIKLEKGELTGEADSHGPNKLVKQTKPDTFQSTSQYASILTFTRDATTQEITGFTMQIMGQELIATKKK
jgi:hypothetical protein